MRRAEQPALHVRLLLVHRWGQTAQVAKADVVVASYEALAGDAAALGALPWELICCDERTRMASGLGRAYQALAGFDARARAVVSSPALLQQARECCPSAAGPTFCWPFPKPPRTVSAHGACSAVTGFGFVLLSGSCILACCMQLSAAVVSLVLTAHVLKHQKGSSRSVSKADRLRGAPAGRRGRAAAGDAVPGGRV